MQNMDVEHCNHALEIMMEKAFLLSDVSFFSVIPTTAKRFTRAVLNKITLYFTRRESVKQ